MQRFLSNAKGFFWSWGFLEFVLLVIALLVIVYIEEDWRGTHHWLAAKAAWEAKGESSDYNKFVPPPIPDDKNLAALPLFKLEKVQDSTGRSQFEDVTLRQAMRDDLQIPTTGNWYKGELPNFISIKKTLADDYGVACKNTSPRMIPSLNSMPSIRSLLNSSRRPKRDRFAESTRIIRRNLPYGAPLVP